MWTGRVVAASCATGVASCASAPGIVEAAIAKSASALPASATRERQRTVTGTSLSMRAKRSPQWVVTSVSRSTNRCENGSRRCPRVDQAATESSLSPRLPLAQSLSQCRERGLRSRGPAPWSFRPTHWTWTSPDDVENDGSLPVRRYAIGRICSSRASGVPVRTCAQATVTSSCIPWSAWFPMGQ